MSSFDFSSLLSEITPAYPSSLPMGSLAKTAFEINPFLEKVATDPYKTLDINVLSQSQLAIDSVFDYIKDYIPKDIVDIFTNNKDVINLLASSNKDIYSLVNEVNSYLPSGFDTYTVLRNTSFNQLYENIYTLTQALNPYNISLDRITPELVISSINFIGEMKHSFSSYQYTSIAPNYSVTALLTNTTKADPFAKTALALNVIKNNALTLPPVSSFLSNISNEDTSKALPFIYEVSSSSFIVISSTVTTIGKELTYFILNDVHDTNYGNVIDKLNLIKTYLFSLNSKQILVVNTNFNNVISTNEDSIPKVIENMSYSLYLIGRTHFNSIKYIYDAHPELTATIGEYILYYGMDVLFPISVHIQSLTFTAVLTVLNELVTLLKTHTQRQIKSVLDYVETHSVSEYIDTFGAGDYVTLLNNITTYGLPVNKDAANLAFIANTDKAMIICENINTFTYNNLYILSGLTSLYSDEIIGSCIIHLNTIPTEDLTHLLLVTDTLNTTMTYSLIVLINRLTLSNAEIFIKNLTLYNYDNLYNAIPLLPQLTGDNVNDIVNNIKSTEIDSTFSYFTVEGNFLIYGIKKAISLCAQAGNFRMVNKIYTTYKTLFDKQTKQNIIKELLINYTPGIDETIIGYGKACNQLLTLLTTINSNWPYIRRGANLIYNNTLLVKSKPELLQLLLANPLTALPAKLQLDNNYT